MDSQIPRGELREARIAELRKLMESGALKAVQKKEARGKERFPCKWVNKRKEGAVKSRSTIADVKGKNPEKEQQEAFPPAPTTCQR